MSAILEAVVLLEDKLKNLLTKYEFLKNENEVLIENNIQLQNLLKEREQFIDRLQEKYDLLKIAKTIEGSSDNTKETKLKINALIREIDKCIIQLSS